MTMKMDTFYLDIVSVIKIFEIWFKPTDIILGHIK